MKSRKSRTDYGKTSFSRRLESESTMKQQHQNIPRLPRIFLNHFLPELDQRFLAGDIEEIYNAIITDKGKRKADLWLSKQAAKSIPLYIIDSIFWSAVMFKNFLTIAFRNLFKHKGYSFINVAGLALGMACCLFIMLWVFEELSYDRFHENIDHLYRVEQDQFYSGESYHVNVTPYPMGEGIKEEIPEIIDATRYTGTGNVLLKYEDKSFFEGGIRAVDPSIFHMFTFPLVKGDPNTALDEPHGMVISEEMADKYFGIEDPMGKILIGNHQHSFTVTGVMKNVPPNSDMQFDILIPFEFIKEIGRYNPSWGSNSIITLVQLHDQASVPDVNEKITQVRHNHVAETIEDPEILQRFNERQRTEFMLKPLAEVHLRSHFGYGHSPGAIQYVYIFSIIALFVLLIACINFMNLATARSAGRAREVGLRKVVGAVKPNLIGQFYGESILLAFIALLFAFLITALLLPHFNNLAEKEFAFRDLFHLRFIIGMIAVTIVTGLIAGSYPALFLSAFQPVKVLKGGLSGGKGSALFRKVLVLTQFTLSIFLIIGTTVVYKQSNYMQHKKLGFDKEHVIYIPLRGNTKESYQVLKQAWLNDPNVINVSGSQSWPAHFGSNSGGGDWEGKDPEQTVLISQNRVAFDYIETMKIEIAGGRTFSRSFSTDTATAFIINEELQRIMGKESAVNERFDFAGIEGTIVGVMKDYHFQSLHNEIEPLAIWVRPDRINYALIRLAAGNIPQALKSVEEVWNRIVPDYPFVHQFLDEAINSMYDDERTTGTLLQVFAVLAVLIACLGLFGLASFTAEQRTKEIGVRKTLGASVPNIALLLSREFTKWVIISNLIAWPVGYLVLNNWLQDYPFRTPLSWWIFAGSGVIALIVAVLTVSYQAVKAALNNPALSLRYE